MAETLAYVSPTTATSPWTHVRFWGAFLLIGVISVPTSEIAASLYFREQELITIGGTIFASVCLLVAGGALAFAHTISPKWFSSPLAAALFAAAGPGVGIAVFCVLVSFL